MSRSLKSLRQELEDTRRELASKEAAFESQEAELVAARQRADELSSSVRHNELQHRDHVVGLEAKLVTAEERVAGIDASALKWRRIAEERGKKIRGLRRQLLKAQETSAKRLREVRDLRASRSWRIGRVITRPFAGLRRSR
jgi:chromosome segregation ATPase